MVRDGRFVLASALGYISLYIGSASPEADSSQANKMQLRLGLHSIGIWQPKTSSSSLTGWEGHAGERGSGSPLGRMKLRSTAFGSASNAIAIIVDEILPKLGDSKALAHVHTFQRIPSPPAHFSLLLTPAWPERPWYY